ncbi:NADP-dependent oxidoreductase [Nevskia soli]|uniref:NADP-dependent oxidoreductase n=1 Tax=Nevskia soli TaxID=418856 RepID=UPI001C5CBEC0|nr:NADP-dependent oxidoreductase [Nevskia soli]
MPIRSREIRLASRPHGEPSLEQFSFDTVDLPDPGPGEVLVRNLFISVDPYMRGRMNEGPSYVPAFEIGKAMGGAAIGRVVQSKADNLPEGSLVLSSFGWREAFVAPAGHVQALDPQGAPLTAFLGTLGVTGLTAWGGLFKAASLQDGETVFVSGAAGAVGNVACQFAKLHGCRVIGSAGSTEKIEFLRSELNVDYAFNYNDGDPAQHLRQGAPEGIDVYFDNTAGPQLEAALSSLKMRGRVALCGAIAGYNRPVPGPRNLGLAIGKRIRLQGFIVTDYFPELPAFHAEAIPALLSGKLASHETVVEGLDQAPAAFLSLLHSGDPHTGKLVVRLGD